MKTHITIKADLENNAELFWDTFREILPAIADEITESQTLETTVSVETWRQIQSIEGFADGPKHAPTALIEVA